jgi:hypothetical protein
LCQVPQLLVAEPGSDQYELLLLVVLSTAAVCLISHDTCCFAAGAGEGRRCAGHCVYMHAVLGNMRVKP